MIAYHQFDEKEESNSLLRFGYSKDHRPDLRRHWFRKLGKLEALSTVS